MFSADVFIETDVLDAVRETVKDAPRRMRTEMGKIARGPLAQALIRDLSAAPAKPRYPFLWKSSKQRRYVMAMRRKAGFPPRTGRLQRGWTVTLQDIETSGTFAVTNPARYARFVQGLDAQPGHIYSGWPDAQRVIRAHSPAFQDAVIAAWYRVCTRQTK